jgi:polyisoprenyl-phosphate glycosyltransferase
MTGTLWFILPMYFDVDAFMILRQRLAEVVPTAAASKGLTATFVVVDDSAGRDPDVARLSGLKDTLVVTPLFNLGHQRAVVFGVRRMASAIADDDIVVTLDADGEDRPEDLPELLAPILRSDANELSVALARRTHRKESLPFKVWYLLFRILFRTLTGMTVRTGNYAAYRGRVARRTLFHPSFDLCYSSTFLSLDMTRYLVPCPRGTRYAGVSRMNTGRLAMHGLRMLMPFLDRIATRALAFFLALFSLGVAASLAILSIRLLTESAIPGWATYTLLLLGVLSLVALGNFVILFSIFSQSRAASLTREEGRNERT